MSPVNDDQSTRDQISEEIYQNLYQLSQKVYKREAVRGFFKKSFKLILSLLSLAGILSILFYLTFVRIHLGKLSDEITRYSDEVAHLTSEIEKLAASERIYRNKVDEYRGILNNLVIEDSRIVDFDLTQTVRENIDGFGNSDYEYYNIGRGNTNFKETALTYDLSSGEDLPIVYAILNRLNTKATIFISNDMSSIGYGSLFKDRNIHYLAKMGELGCEFGNHTWSHYHLTRSLYEISKRKRLNLSFISDEVIDEFSLMLEFDRVRKIFKERTGFELSPLWRAPYGAIDHRVLTVAAKLGYPYHISWSGNELGPLDFFDYVKKRMVRIYNNDKNKNSLVKNPNYYTSGELLSRMKEWEKADLHGLNGAISIAHLGTTRKVDRMIKILPEYISYFRSNGYHFVTVSEIINNRKDY
jgi:peptidoglycan/xylan/chitin deacetylase (PgdA/CDA1 family)